jgi:hypothetical protein
VNISEVVEQLEAIREAKGDIEVQVWSGGLGYDTLSISTDVYYLGSKPTVPIPTVIIRNAR